MRQISYATLLSSMFSFSCCSHVAIIKSFDFQVVTGLQRRELGAGLGDYRIARLSLQDDGCLESP